MDAKRGLLVVLLLVILATNASAYITEVFSGTVKSGESIDIDDYTLIVTLSRQNRLFVDAIDDFASLDLDQCGELKNIRICFNNITIDDTELVTYVDITINKTEPKIDITRTISKTEFFVGEELTVTSKVKNTGDDALDATYLEEWGPDAEVVSVESGFCILERGRIIWRGFLKKDQELNCEYKIKFKEPVERGYVGTFKYYNGYNYETEVSTELVLKAKDAVQMDSRFVGQDVEVESNTFSYDAEDDSASPGEKVRLVINLSNQIEGDVDLTVNSFTVQYPSNVELQSFIFGTGSY